MRKVALDLGTRKTAYCEVREGKVVRAIATGQEISHMVAVTPEGNRAFVANIGSGSVTVVDLQTGQKLTDIPTLDQLIAEPSKTLSLPPDIARRYLSALANLQPLLIAQSERGAKIPVPDDALIGVEEVAGLIGLSPSWVEKHPDALPIRRSVGGNPRWLKSEVIAWIKARPPYGQAS